MCQPCYTLGLSAVIGPNTGCPLNVTTSVALVNTPCPPALGVHASLGQVPDGNDVGLTSMVGGTAGTVAFPLFYWKMRSDWRIQ